MKTKALSFIEIVFIVAIFTIITVAVLPNFANLLFSNQIEVGGQEVVHVLRRANIQATQQFRDSNWGVQFDETNDTYTFFTGTTYELRDTDYDDLYVLPAAISFNSVSLTGGGTGVIFDQGTGKTSQDGTVSLLSNYGSSVTITINSQGHVSKN